MAIGMSVDDMDRRRDRPPERGESPDGDRSPLPPPPPPSPRRRDLSSDDRHNRPPDRQDDYRGSRSRSPSLPPPPPPPHPPSASLGGPRGDRDREYRRRSSPSPPSYFHRDRRHSPPRRSPPPGSFKRARREDGGYERRRGSPRGNFVPDDRRYGYDYGGYDRGSSRGGYGDEKVHGRSMSRASEWSDPGRSGANDGPGVNQREGLMTYKQFIQELEDDILPAEAERRYQEYRAKFISTQKSAFFETHKEEQWLKDKYHPTHLLPVIERRNEQARLIAKEFLLDLQSGTLDLGPGLTGSTPSKSGNGSETNSEDEADSTGKRRRHNREPAKDKDLLSAAPKAHPVSSESRRIQVDIEQALALVRKLDTEKGIQENVLSSSDCDKMDGDSGGSMGPIIIIRGLTTVKGLEGVELLDTLVTYLWRVHGLDYYGMSESHEAKGLRHVRYVGKAQDENNNSGSDWEKIDSHWRTRLSGQDPLEILTAKDKIDAAAAEALDPYVKKIRDEKYGWKYGCGAKGCSKLFHAPEYVYKHLKLKHPDLVMELTSKVREDLYRQNYMNDPNASGRIPVMQQSAPKKVLRRRSGLENRLRDERGSRRHQYRDDDRHDKAGHLPSCDANGASEGGILEEPTYDAYRGQGMHGPPFPSDLSHPPVLVPVPGAGPLGPFIPAPPDVAVRVLREQGGQSPFESNAGPRSRKRGLGLQFGGAAPILPAPPFRQDPRRLRSYQDLDAPEDEVTVIDYRTL